MMRVIFDAGPQRWKIWFVLLISLVCGGGMVFAGGYMLMNYGMQPADGGALKPLGSRMLICGVLALPGAAIIAAILLYLQLYVTRMEVDDAGDGVRVSIAGFGSPLIVNRTDVAGSGYHDGVSQAGGMSVNAPWYSLRLRGRRFPLIVDVQGNFHDEHAVGRLIKGEPPPPMDRRTNPKPLGKKRRR